MTKVIYYTNFNRNPIDDFLNSLTAKQQSKVLRVFNYIEKYGLNAVLPHLKKLKGHLLWEIRILGTDNIRVLYVLVHLDMVLVLHGFFKKSQKTPEKEMSIALNRLEEYRSR